MKWLSQKKQPPEASGNHRGSMQNFQRLVLLKFTFLRIWRFHHTAVPPKWYSHFWLLTSSYNIQPTIYQNPQKPTLCELTFLFEDSITLLKVNETFSPNRSSDSCHTNQTKKASSIQTSPLRKATKTPNNLQ